MKCENCKFSEKTFTENNIMLYCRKFPPIMGIWPVVKSNDYCSMGVLNDIYNEKKRIIRKGKKLWK